MDLRENQFEGGPRVATDHEFGSVSLDGYMAVRAKTKPIRSAEMAPPARWIFATSRAVRDRQDGGSQGVDDGIQPGLAKWADHHGRNMFGPVRGTWEGSNWRGWWGESRPFISVFVLTHLNDRIL